jgi:hypothetical protein
MGQTGQKYYKAEVIWQCLIDRLILLKAAGPEFFCFFCCGCRIETARQSDKHLICPQKSLFNSHGVENLRQPVCRLCPKSRKKQ